MEIQTTTAASDQVRASKGRGNQFEIIGDQLTLILDTLHLNKMALSTSRLAEITGLSITTIKERTSRLIKNGVICCAIRPTNSNREKVYWPTKRRK